MKPSRPSSVLYAIALLAIITVNCDKACASLLELKSQKPDNQEQNISVRPCNLFTITSCSRLSFDVSGKYKTTMSLPAIVYDYEASGWQIHSAVVPCRRYAGQTPPVFEPGFMRQKSMYKFALLRVIYEKTLLRESYICSTSGMDR